MGVLWRQWSQSVLAVRRQCASCCCAVLLVQGRTLGPSRWWSVAVEQQASREWLVLQLILGRPMQHTVRSRPPFCTVLHEHVGPRMACRVEQVTVAKPSLCV